MLENLVLSTVMIVATTAVHFAGLAGLLELLQHRAGGAGGNRERLSFQFAMIMVVVFGLFALHGVEIWLYALVYLFLNEFSGFEEALYFSTSTFTTVGFGDIYLDARWRLFSAIESANGFLLIGWSTAFLISVTARMRTLEAKLRWKRGEEEDDD